MKIVGIQPQKIENINIVTRGTIGEPLGLANNSYPKHTESFNNYSNSLFELGILEKNEVQIKPSKRRNV
jgi:hypothetical protein